MNRMLAYLAVVTVGIAASVNAQAHQHDEATTIFVKHPWARETPPTVTTSAAYLIIDNKGKEMDRLVGISGEVAEKIELHTHLLEDGVMRMRSVDAVEVHPGEPVIFKPGGLHIMLIDLKGPLVAGQTFSLTLHFEEAGDIPMEVTVRRPGAVTEQHYHQHPGEMKRHH